MFSNACEICGKPCRKKYCAGCRVEANRRKQKEWQEANKKGGRKPRYKGCNEDCEHCPYPDCYRPYSEMRATSEVINLQETRDEKLKSQGKMYSVTLGKYNAQYPNSNRKAWW